MGYTVDFSSLLLLLVAVVDKLSCKFLEYLEVLFVELSFKLALSLLKELREGGLDHDAEMLGLRFKVFVEFLEHYSVLFFKSLLQALLYGLANL